MHIIYIHKDRLAKRPPVISALLILNELGHDVTLFDEEISDHWKSVLQKREIRFIETKTTVRKSITSKLLSYYRFQKIVFAELAARTARGEDFIVWIEGAQTIVALGTKLNAYRHILQIQELHEKSQRQMKAIGKVIHSAEAVFMPEYCRSALYRVWFKLEKPPVVLPNKPYFIPTPDELESYRERYAEHTALFSKYKVILYQGHIHPERDLTAFAEASLRLPKDYKLVLLGHDHGDVARYRNINPDIIHIDFVPAPYYLMMTSMCHIGIVTYSALELNTTFCAPNKIYEYAGFGKPMIGNDIPGLQLIKHYRAGILVDERNTHSILNAIEEIEKNYHTYHENTFSFWDNTDNKEIIRSVLTSIVQ